MKIWNWNQMILLLFDETTFVLYFCRNIDFTVLKNTFKLFGDRLSEIRKKKKISQDDLVKKIGVHAPVIGSYERSEVKPSIEVAV